MAHYAYKEVCYDIDYDKFSELKARFEKENKRECDDNANYDGDYWLIAAMWIDELRAQVAELTELVKKKDDALLDGAQLLSDWGAYADEYYQKKHDLAGDIQRLKNAAALTANTYQSEGHFAQTNETIKHNGETLAGALTVKEQ